MREGYISMRASNLHSKLISYLGLVGVAGNPGVLRLVLDILCHLQRDISPNGVPEKADH